MSLQLFFDQGHDLAQLVHNVLMRNPHLSARHLEYEVRDQDVIVRGIVSSYYHKQLVQESIRAINGVETVHNDLEVMSI